MTTAAYYDAGRRDGLDGMEGPSWPIGNSRDWGVTFASVAGAGLAGATTVVAGGAALVQAARHRPAGASGLLASVGAGVTLALIGGLEYGDDLYAAANKKYMR